MNITSASPLDPLRLAGRTLRMTLRGAPLNRTGIGPLRVDSPFSKAFLSAAPTSSLSSGRTIWVRSWDGGPAGIKR